jgi:hypothetical protein
MQKRQMRSPRRRLLLVFALLALAAGSGCANTERREFAQELGPLVGRAPIAYFIDRYGEPEKTIPVDSRTKILQFQVAAEPLADHGARVNLEITTELRLTFKDGILSAWQSSNVVH